MHTHVSSNETFLYVLFLMIKQIINELQALSDLIKARSIE